MTALTTLLKIGIRTINVKNQNLNQKFSALILITYGASVSFPLVLLILLSENIHHPDNYLQEMLAKTVRYESFGRRRVIIRKGHIGVSFYMIYSGSVAVIIHGDEDQAFLEHRPPEIVFRRGDSFGEVALAKSAPRTATVVCLERTDFFVVDKDSFFKVGIDEFSKIEIEHREICVKSIKLLDAVDEKICKDIAEEGRVVKYSSDKVIEIDSSDSQFVYLITKGSCYVLRLIDLRKHQHRVNAKMHEGKKLINKYCENTKHKTKVEKNGEAVACLKVDDLYSGDTFGLHFLFQYDEIVDNRRFSVVSAGCEVMRVPRTCIEEINDHDVIKKLKNSVRWYPSDEVLYTQYKVNDGWRSFRQNIVSDVLQKPYGK